MSNRVFKALVPAAFAVCLAVPAAAQIPLPRLEVHITNGAPPRLRHERIPRRPGPEYAWVSGAWDWNGARWVWVPGRWVIPDQPNAYWVSPSYVQVDGGYRYEPGHWSHQRVVVGEDYRRWHDRHQDWDHDRWGDRHDNDRHDHDRHDNDRRDNDRRDNDRRDRDKDRDHDHDRNR